MKIYVSFFFDVLFENNIFVFLLIFMRYTRFLLLKASIKEKRSDAESTN